MNNANIDKIKKMARENGVKIKYICSQLGLSETYLSNCKNGKDRMTDERLQKIAAILGTSTDYLMDLTDDPRPMDNSVTVRSSEDEKLIDLFAEKLTDLSEEEKTVIRDLLKLPRTEVSRCIEVLRLILK